MKSWLVCFLFLISCKLETSVSNGSVDPVIDKTIGDFTLVTQEGEEVTDQYFLDKIVVSSFFFTECEQICQSVQDNLLEVYEHFLTNEDVKILSHSILPEKDNIKVLFDYSGKLSVNNKEWYFLTGKKDVLNKIMKNDYLLNPEELQSNPEQLQTIFLIDQENKIKGSYQGNDKSDIKRLISDIDKLILLQKQKENQDLINKMHILNLKKNGNL